MKGDATHATAARKIESKIGSLQLFATAEGLAGLFFGHRVAGLEVPPDDLANPHLNAAETQLREFFDGSLIGFGGGLELKRQLLTLEGALLDLS